MKRQINKTVATLLTTLTGSLGLHRFYMYGQKDFWGWTYFTGSLLYLSLVVSQMPETPFANNYFALFPLPAYVSVIESLVIGLTPDEKWDAKHNPGALNPTRSAWPLAVILILTLFCGYTAFVTSIARASDLLYTSGSFG